MTGRQVAILAVPPLIVGSVGAVIGAVAGPAHWLAALTAIAVCAVPAFGTFWLTNYLVGRSPFGGLIGMMVGLVVRMVVAVGGGMAAFFGTDAFEDAKLGFWLWLLATYLATLVAETLLIAGGSIPATGAQAGKE